MSELEHGDAHELSKDERVDAARRRFEEMKKKMKKKKKAHTIDFSKPVQPASTSTNTTTEAPPISKPLSTSNEVDSVSIPAAASSETPIGSLAAEIQPQVQHLPVSTFQSAWEAPSTLAADHDTTDNFFDEISKEPEVVSVHPPVADSAPSLDTHQSAKLTHSEQSHSNQFDQAFESYNPNPSNSQDSPSVSTAVNPYSPVQQKSEISESKKYQLTPEDLFGPSTSSNDNVFLFSQPQSAPFPTFASPTSAVKPLVEQKSQPAQQYDQATVPSQEQPALPKVDPMDLFGDSVDTGFDPFAPAPTQRSGLLAASANPTSTETKAESFEAIVGGHQDDANEVTPSANKQQSNSTDFESIFGESLTAANTDFDDLFKSNSQSKVQNVNDEPEVNNDVQQDAEIVFNEEEDNAETESYFGMTSASPERKKSFEDVLAAVERRKSFEEVLDAAEKISAPKHLTAEDLFGPSTPSAELGEDDIFGPYEPTQDVLVRNSFGGSRRSSRSNPVSAPLPAKAKEEKPDSSMFEVDLNAPDDDFFSQVKASENLAPFYPVSSEDKGIPASQIPESSGSKQIPVDPTTEVPVAKSNDERLETTTSIEDPQEIEQKKSELVTERETASEPPQVGDEVVPVSNDEIERLKAIIKEQESIIKEQEATIKRQREENTNIKLSRMDLNDRILDLEDEIAELKELQESGDIPINVIAHEDFPEVPVIEDQPSRTESKLEEAYTVPAKQEEPKPKKNVMDTDFDSLFAPINVPSQNSGFSERGALSSEQKINSPIKDQDASLAKPLTADDLFADLNKVTTAPSATQSQPLWAPENKGASVPTVDDSAKKQQAASTIGDFRERLMVWKGWQIDMTQWNGSDAPKIAL